jgi:mono/diheme cytochrome c family protein
MSCENSNARADIGYGKSYFTINCSSCHGRNDGFGNAPSLLTLNDYDSLILLRKLRDIKKDSLHSDYFRSVKYSDREINSIREYIKNYFEPHY